MRSFKPKKLGVIGSILAGILSYGCGNSNTPAENLPPIINTNPIEQTAVGASYSYDADAEDLDGDSLTWSLVDGPAGMSINSGTGVVSWSPVLGKHYVELQVSDGKGGIDNQNYNLLATSEFEDLSDKSHYVVVTNNALSATFQGLADWKTSKGVITQVHSIEDIVSGYPGRDDAERLRNFLKAKKSKHPELEYVLLGGDCEVVPMRGVYGQATGYPEDFNIPCDLYFSDLDGSWDADGDSTFGEVPSDNVDMHPDLFVGRAPVNTISEAGTFVGKVLLYEKGVNGSDTLDTGYITKGGDNVLFCAEKLSATTDSAIAKDWINGNVYDFTGNGFGLKRLYETAADSKWDGNRDNLSVEDYVSVMDALNNGHHTVNLCGHGGADILQVGAGLTDYIHSRDGSPAEKDIRNLTNLTRPFILYSLGCMTNAFDNTASFPTGDCIGEHFVLNPNGGAVASIGESRIGLYQEGGDGTGDSWNYDCEFVKSLFTKDINNLGKAFADAKEQRINISKISKDDRWIQYCLNLLGEPEMNVWKDCLGNITAAVNTGTNYIEVTANVSGANVCINDGVNVYRALTNSDGKALLPINGTVTVTKKDYLPYVK